MDEKVVALGELLIDFINNGRSDQGNQLMEINPGGAPGNVLAMLAKLGKKTSFIGKVGDDCFGRLLKDTLKEVGIDTVGVKFDQSVNTTLAFVHTKDDGDREFSFYRNPGADMMLEEEDIEEELLKDCKIFHYGSLSMTDKNCRKATKKAIEIAKANGAILSFDPNLREPLWKNLDEAKEQIDYGMQQCDILKISDNEIVWFTEKEDYEEGIQYLQSRYMIPLIVLSLGKNGSRAYCQGVKAEVPAVLSTQTVETTGAGDTFCACVLNYVLEHSWKPYTEEELKEMLSFANAAASIITTRKGALRVMPTRNEVDALLRLKKRDVS